MELGRRRILPAKTKVAAQRLPFVALINFSEKCLPLKERTTLRKLRARSVLLLLCAHSHDESITVALMIAGSGVRDL